jgi:tetratricopeptide (TPR) repeat protein
MMIVETQQRYYRIALAAAQRRDLSRAALYARYVLALNADHEGAAKLLEICRDELGESVEDGLDKIRALAGQKKWRAAEKAARALPRQSVRILNIRGCLHAAAKHYRRAADCFARALIMDRSNTLAAEGFAEAASRRIFLPWGR